MLSVEVNTIKGNLWLDRLRWRCRVSKATGLIDKNSAVLTIYLALQHCDVMCQYRYSCGGCLLATYLGEFNGLLAPDLALLGGLFTTFRQEASLDSSAWKIVSFNSSSEATQNIIKLWLNIT